VMATEEKKILHTKLGPLSGTSSPFGALSRRELNPIKLAHSPSRPDGYTYGQYASNPGNRPSVMQNSKRRSAGLSQQQQQQ